MNINEFGDLKGHIISDIQNDDNYELTFTLSDDRKYRLYHEQDCCEVVRIEDIIGDLEDLIGTPILLAEEVSSTGEKKVSESDVSCTWTFYKLSTIKGSVTIRWYGKSNGYYSETVDFKQVVNYLPLKETKQMGNVSDETKELIMLAVAISDKPVYATLLAKTTLKEFHITTICAGLSALAEDGYLSRSKGIVANKMVKLFQLTKKPFAYASHNSVNIQTSPKSTENQIPDKFNVPVIKPNKDSIEGWLITLNQLISNLEETKKQIPTVLAGLLDLTRDFDRISKVKDILNGVKAEIRKNI